MTVARRIEATVIARRSLLAAVALAVGIVVLLLVFADIDPAPGVTRSGSPFSDETWNVLNARNLVLLGHWATDQFNLYLLSGPFSLLEAAVFSLLGVGIVQARLVPILSVGATVLLLGAGLRRPFGALGALLSALAYGTSLLVLYYGRLAYPEILLNAALTAGALLALRADGPASARWGLAAGLCFGLAIASKANAAFEAVGFVGAVALVEGGRPDVRRWLAGTVVGVGTVGLAWLGLVFVPQREALSTDLRILHHFQVPNTVGGLVRRIGSYPFRSDGGVPATLPVALGGALGAALGVAGRHALSPPRRRLLAGSLGWLVVGLAVVVVVDYRPNRYLLPLLPAAAILVGLAVALLEERFAPRWRRARSLAVALLAAALLALPGLVAFAGWVAAGTRRLPEAQAAVLGMVPAGAAVEGALAPALAMRAPVLTIVPWPTARANVGDLYASWGVRWVVGDGAFVPSWASAHPAAWAARRERYCLEWPPGSTVCLYQLP